MAAEVEDGLGTTAFRLAEKRYQLHRQQKMQFSKGRMRAKGWIVKETDFSQVMDFDMIDEANLPAGVNRQLPKSGNDNQKIYSFDAHPGFFLLPGALDQIEQVELIRHAWLDYPNPPARTNLFKQYGDLPDLFVAAAGNMNLQVEATRRQQDSGDEVLSEKSSRSSHANVENEGTGKCGLDGFQEQLVAGCPNLVDCRSTPEDSYARNSLEGPGDCWEAHCSGPSAVSLLQKLRWATLGPHFDWTAREYIASIQHKTLPTLLEGIGQKIARMLGILFQPDAALVNYYYKGSTIGGHKDDAEEDMSQPIVSLSLGCPAVFLMGGDTREAEPTALWLRTGDVVVLSGKARECYHGVPRVLTGDGSHLETLAEGQGVAAPPFLEKMRDARINISIRRVLPT